MSVRRSLAAVLLLAGCYSPTVTPGSPCSARGECPSGLACEKSFCVVAGTADGPPTVQVDAQVPPDASQLCLAGDNVCRYGCADLDSDCDTTCGDGRCVGNANELCATCPADCNTQSPACGNGACEAGESPICYADCGPSPWTWETEESALASKINLLRTSGYQCPGAGMPHTAPAFIEGDYLADAREWAWEIAHQAFHGANGISCNGRTFPERAQNKHYNSYISAYGYDTIDDALSAWMSSDSACAELLSTDISTIQVAVAHDQLGSYILLFGP